MSGPEKTEVRLGTSYYAIGPGSRAIFSGSIKSIKISEAGGRGTTLTRF